MEGDSNLEQEKGHVKREGYGEPAHEKAKEHLPHKEHVKIKEREPRRFEKSHHKKKPFFRQRQEPYQFRENKNVPREQPRFGSLDIKQASTTAKEKLAEALNKKANTVVSVSKEGENWNAVIEIIDEEYLPGKNLDSMSDIIGVYEVKLSNNGELLSWTKKSSRKRGNVSV